MTEGPSTLDLLFRWASNEIPTGEAAPTGFFLFQEAEGRVGLRGDPEDGETVLGDPSTSASVTATNPADRDSSRPKPRRVPQTRVLRGHTDQRYILLKKYEGFVTARGEDGFSARLVENNSDYPVIEAEFDLEELSETDRELAIEGAPLVWTIGYAYEGSTRKRESRIYLRRLPALSDKELEKGRAAADDLTRAIRWE